MGKSARNDNAAPKPGTQAAYCEKLGIRQKDDQDDLRKHCLRFLKSRANDPRSRPFDLDEVTEAYAEHILKEFPKEKANTLRPWENIVSEQLRRPDSGIQQGFRGIVRRQQLNVRRAIERTGAETRGGTRRASIEVQIPEQNPCDALNRAASEPATQRRRPRDIYEIASQSDDEDLQRVTKRQKLALPIRDKYLSLQSKEVKQLADHNCRGLRETSLPRSKTLESGPRTRQRAGSMSSSAMPRQIDILGLGEYAEDEGDDSDYREEIEAGDGGDMNDDEEHLPSASNFQQRRRYSWAAEIPAQKTHMGRTIVPSSPDSPIFIKQTPTLTPTEAPLSPQPQQLLPRSPSEVKSALYTSDAQQLQPEIIDISASARPPSDDWTRYFIQNSGYFAPVADMTSGTELSTISVVTGSGEVDGFDDRLARAVASAREVADKLREERALTAEKVAAAEEKAAQVAQELHILIAEGQALSRSMRTDRSR